MAGWATDGLWARTVRVLLLVLGAGLTANAAWLAVTANLTVGTAMAAGLGLGLLAWGFWLPRVRHLRWLNVMAVLLLGWVLAVSCFLAWTGTSETARYDEDAVIVLGAAVHGDELSRTLTSRLDRAVAYHQRNPKALVVVSGGQGPQENLPEGVAMKAYLLTQGVPEASIVLEDRAASTEENFAFAKALLDRRLPSGYRVAFVTDEFHVYRAGRLAAAAGLAADHVSSRTPWYFWPANYLREDLLVVGQWLTKGF
ncbi:MAG: YdcF family protein [Actinobacteria bacterium]|nr:YdcF family protein [Actinomycetota bacterium]